MLPEEAYFSVQETLTSQNRLIRNGPGFPPQSHMLIFKLPPSDSYIGKAGLHRYATAIISRATHEVRDRPHAYFTGTPPFALAIWARLSD